ncbi:hypothetical protein D3C78_960740 [compost metagenome]
MLPGLLAKSFGTMLDLARMSAKRMASSRDCGARLKPLLGLPVVISFMRYSVPAGAGIDQRVMASARPRAMQ